nr:four-carbon acid sugar kinase family protein [Salipaludibacillus agaradhaerens]
MAGGDEVEVLIIADDLTGANDTGVQFARRHLQTKVLINKEALIDKDIDILVLDTDSRSSPYHEAYEKVKQALEAVKSYDMKWIYKKVDSTMRGNIGVELDAILNYSDAKFIVMAPGYPDNHRIIRNGNIYVGNHLLEKTYFANDVSTPIKSSAVQTIIEETSDRKIGSITIDDLSNGKSHVQEKIHELRQDNVEIIVCDSANREDLHTLFHSFLHYIEPFVWCGSAGMAEQLAMYLSKGADVPKNKLNFGQGPILIGVGSVHDMTRKQLDYLLEETSIVGIDILTANLLKSEDSKKKELEKAYQRAMMAYRSEQNVALYTMADSETRRGVQKLAKEKKITNAELSYMISSSIGILAKQLMESISIDRAILTGGDTAKRVAEHIGCDQFHLIDVIEEGVPVGILEGKYELLTITKAGGFGEEHSLVHAYLALGGK